MGPEPWWFGPTSISPGAPEAPFDLVLLDRDGTLNVRIEDGYVTRPEQVELLPGAGAMLAAVTAAGCRTVLVTNQRALARGLMSRADLESVHRRLVDDLGRCGGRLDAVAVCPHDIDSCDCRKPRDGLFRAALDRARWARAERCLMVGDMPTDLEPARRLGMRTQCIGPDGGMEAVVEAVTA